MKITFYLTHMKIAGGVRAVLEYADLLKARGHEVVIIVENRNIIRRIIANLFHVKPYWFKNLRAQIIKIPSLDEHNIPDGDIIVATNWMTAETINGYSSRVGKKFFLVQHDEGLYHGPQEKIDKIYRMPFRKIAVSKWLQDVLKEKYGQNSELIVTPVNLNLFRSIDGLRHGQELRVLELHHTAKWKGVAVGMEAFNRVKAEYPNLKLVMFGVRNKEKPIGCDEYFYDIDQKELAKLYSSCDIFLWSAEHDCLGMPSMEAMACKCAIVTYATDGSQEFAFDGETAFVAKFGDVDDLVRKLKLAVADKALREKIAQNGYKFIRSISWDLAVTRIEDIFETEFHSK